MTHDQAKFKMEHETITLSAEECDCYQLFNKRMRFTGGHYHRVRKLHVFTGNNERYVVVLENTNTRNNVKGEPMVCLIYNGDFFELTSEQVLEDTDVYPFLYFRPCEARIIAQSYEAQ